MPCAASAQDANVFLLARSPIEGSQCASQEALAFFTKDGSYHFPATKNSSISVPEQLLFARP